MRVVRPITITNARFTSSTIPEPDTAGGEVAWTAGTYTTGTQRIKAATHRIYQVVATPNTMDDPEVGVLAVPPTWVDIGPTNKWAMFDQVIGTQSVETASPLIIELDPDILFNSVAGFNISGADNINVTIDDPTDGEVYNVDIDMNDNSAIADYYEYFFEPIINLDQFVLLDLPAYPSATMTITMENSSGDIAVGTLVTGQQIPIGTALYGTSWQVLDFSRKERDEFGNFVIVERRNSDLFDYDVSIDKEKFNFVKRQLKLLTTTPCVWSGTGDINDGTLVYGYYKDVQVNISSPSILSCTIQVEGLV